jgi:hypothetical protein
LQQINFIFIRSEIIDQKLHLVSAIFDVWRWNQHIDLASENDVEFVSEVSPLENNITFVKMFPS